MTQAIRLAILSSINLGLGFVFQWFLLTKLGAGTEVDAFFAGMAIPQFVLAIVSGSLMHVLVPLLAGEDEASLSHDAWAFFLLVVGFFGFIAVFLYLTASWWVPWSVPGFSLISQELTVKLTQIQLIGMVFSAAHGVQWAAYHARKKFIWAEVAPTLANALAFVLLLVFLPDFGVVAAAWIGTFRLGIQTLFLLPGLGRPIAPNFKKISVSSAWSRIKPLILGTAYYKTDPILDRVLLSSSTSGSLSLYYFAQQIYAALNSIINKSIVSPLVPQFSEFYKEKKFKELKNSYRYGVFGVSCLVVIFAFVFIFWGSFFLGKLIGYGDFHQNDVLGLWWIMIWLIGAFAGGVLGQISSSMFYSMGDTSTPTRISVLVYTVYMPIKVVLYFNFGIAGLAFSTSCFFLINLIIQNKIIFRYFRKIETK